MSPRDSSKRSDAHVGNPTTAPSFIGTLAPGVHVVGGMGNALSVETDRGVFQLDTGVSPGQARKMIAEGTPLSEVADVVGVSRSTLYRQLIWKQDGT